MFKSEKKEQTYPDNDWKQAPWGLIHGECPLPVHVLQFETLLQIETFHMLNLVTASSRKVKAQSTSIPLVF